MSEKNKMVRVNFTLPEPLKKEWNTFARKILQISTSQMVRNAVREYRNKYKKIEQPRENPEMELMKMKFEKLIDEKMNEIQKSLKVEKVENIEIEEAKDSILSLLEKLQPMKTKEIAKMIRMTSIETLNILEILQLKDKLIKITKEGWKIDE
jgi:metal-responsive CopG/Arc/MetJ family transcriptional regulator